MDNDNDEIFSITVILKPQEWFDEHTYMDEEGDYWKSEEDFNYWQEHSDNFPTLAISPLFVTKNVYVYESFEHNTNKIDWGIDYIPTKDTHPEVFV